MSMTESTAAHRVALAGRRLRALLPAAVASLALAGTALAAPQPLQVAQVAAMPATQAAGAANAQFPDDPVRVAVEQFLQQQTAGLPGKASIQVVPPSGGRAPHCANPEPFLQPGAAPWGRVSVGVRCGGDRPWTRYVQARVSVVADYYVAARALGVGEAIGPADLEPRQGDLANLPRAVVTDPAQVVGATTANRVAAGSPLRTDMLRKTIAVRQGQNVAVRFEGEAFQVTSEGKVLADAAPGNSVQVRLKNGQVVNALVRDAETVVLQ
jgi:flagella basal body P-ring formation protein FlgA